MKTKHLPPLLSLIMPRIFSILFSIFLPFLLFTFIFSLSACAPTDDSRAHAFQQEPITDIEFLPSPNINNPVDFGILLHARPDLRARAISQISTTVRGRLPGVRFMVLKYPVYDYQYGLATSFRNPDEGYIVLSWKPVGNNENEVDNFKVQDVGWEVEHWVAGTDDFGNPLPR